MRRQAQECPLESTTPRPKSLKTCIDSQLQSVKEEFVCRKNRWSLFRKSARKKSERPVGVPAALGGMGVMEVQKRPGHRASGAESFKLALGENRAPRAVPNTMESESWHRARP